MNNETNRSTIKNVDGSVDKQVHHSPAFLRKRKMMLVLPILVIPFLTMAFWALGGGKGSPTEASFNEPGLNLNLPDAKLENDEANDKMSFYELAEKDSIKMQELKRNDPYYKAMADTGILPANELEQLTQNTASRYNQRLNNSPYEVSSDNPEKKILKKLTLLENELNKQPDLKKEEKPVSSPSAGGDEFSGEVDRLENMMQSMQKTGSEDPEMEQLNGTLEKILDIQHPERMKNKLREKSLKNKEQVFILTKQFLKNNISLLDTDKGKRHNENKFYGIEDDSITEEQNTVEAVVHQTQTLVNGAVVKMCLLNDIYLNGSLVPKGNFVFGIAELNDERLEININSIRNNNSLFSVRLEVFDMDGLPGIYIPGAISRDVAKQSADNSLQLMELTSMNPSFKAQAAATGINAAKSLLSKKIKQVKVLVKAGYKVLLRDKNIQQ